MLTRTALVVVATVSFVLGLVALFGGHGTSLRVYQSIGSVWSIQYPRGLHVVSECDCATGGHPTAVATFATFEPKRWSRPGGRWVESPPQGSGPFPAHAFALRVLSARLGDDSTERAPVQRAFVVSGRCVTSFGSVYDVEVWTGRDVTPSQRATVARMIASIRVRCPSGA